MPSEIAIARVPNLRIFVLGWPRDARLLGITEWANEMPALIWPCNSTSEQTIMVSCWH